MEILLFWFVSLLRLVRGAKFGKVPGNDFCVLMRLERLDY
jgi:hypothetical protein